MRLHDLPLRGGVYRSRYADHGGRLQLNAMIDSKIWLKITRSKDS